MNLNKIFTGLHLALEVLIWEGFNEKNKPSLNSVAAAGKKY